MKTTTGVLIATIVASSMVFIDGTVVNVILPVLQKEFSAQPTEIVWVVEAYLLLLASLILIGGSLGDLFGRKKIFQIGTGLFVLTSLGCGLSQTLFQLTICRALQGVGGALLTPGSLAIINSYFPPEERGKAIGSWSGFSGLMAALGPLLGGWLSDEVSWRWVFLINAPLGFLALFFSAKYVPESRAEERVRLDFIGVVFSSLAIGFLIYGLIESMGMVTLAGFILLAAFLFIEKKVLHPLVPLTFFKSRVFSTINLLTFFLYGALTIVFYFLPFNLIQIQGFSATQAGAANLPFVVIIFLFSRWTGGLYNKIGARIPITIGSGLVGLSFLGLGFLPGLNAGYWTHFFLPMVLFGFGMALCISPLTTAVLSALPEKYSGIASAINNSLSRIGGLIGIALVTYFFAKPLALNLAGPAEKLAYLATLREIMVGCAGLAFLSGLCAFGWLRSPVRRVPVGN